MSNQSLTLGRYLGDFVEDIYAFVGDRIVVGSDDWTILEKRYFIRNASYDYDIDLQIVDTKQPQQTPLDLATVRPKRPLQNATYDIPTPPNLKPGTPQFHLIIKKGEKYAESGQSWTIKGKSFEEDAQGELTIQLDK